VEVEDDRNVFRKLLVGLVDVKFERGSVLYGDCLTVLIISTGSRDPASLRKYSVVCGCSACAAISRNHKRT
jgi:hypothetical protein